MGQFDYIIELLIEINEDTTVPKNIRSEIQATIKDLENCEGMDHALKCDEWVEKLGDLTNNPQVPSHTRTELLSIVCALEQNR